MGAKSQSSQQLCCKSQPYNSYDALRDFLLVSGQDQIVWAASSDNTFNLKSTYSSVQNNIGTADYLFKLAWKWNGLERIRSFIWLVAHEAILTNAEWKRRHLTVDARCHRCNFVTEDALHVLRNCSFATTIWNLLQANQKVQDFFNLNIRDCSIMRAELWAVIKGLQITSIKKYNHLIVESDSAIAIKFISEGCLPLHPCKPLVEDIKVLANGIPQILWCHTLKEANSVADQLAKNGQDLPLDFYLFDKPLPNISLALSFDSYSSFRIRNVS
ncbi:hypothetical protein Ahy_A03g014090 [Arachis hypogaea]|uniref:Reverse transcriptase zinc-binding domain-containing protein n=1 Tax=Arachis hypogaea TaxID=3818 RepID=A0A445DWY2_ARAHY|nr:hypothetical protein Ahy_A03g014090 [Arachis hypogaea]